MALDYLGHLRKYGCLIPYTNDPWVYTANPELSVFQNWLLEPLRFCPQTFM